MGPQDTSVELRPNVAKEIRDRLVGKLFQVKLKIEAHQEGARSPRGFFKKFTSKVGISRTPRSHQAKEYKEDATVLLTVESLEVYTGSNNDSSREHVETSQGSDPNAPPLHSPPSSLEGHVYSYSISMSQVLRVAQSDADVTVFFHPNVADAELSADASASFVCEFLEPQDAAEFVAGLRSVLEQFAHAMLHIGQGYTLQEKAEILAITQGPLTKARDLWRKGKTSPGQAAETVIARAPEWETDHAMPASWTLPGGSEEALYVYMATPLGPALAQITEQHLLKGRAERDGSFNVVATVSHQAGLERESHTIHRDSSKPNLPAAGSRRVLGEKEDKRVKLFCQIVDDSGKLLTRRSLSIRRSSSIPWQASQSLDADSTKSSAAAVPGPSKEPSRTHFRGLSTKRVLIGLFLVGPWFVQLLDQAGLLHHPESHFMHAMVNLFSAIWAVAVVGIALNGGLMQFHPGPSSAGASNPAIAAVPVQSAFSNAAPPADMHIKLIKAEVEEQWGGGKAMADTQQLGNLQDVQDEESSEGEEEDSESMPSPSNNFNFPPDIVARFEEGYRGNPTARMEAMRKTYEWRRSIDGWNMLEQPQPFFATFKGLFDHGVMALTKKHHPVWVIKAGMMREGWKKYQKSDATDRDVARHICFTHDYMYHVLDKSTLPGGRAIWINDLKGMGLRDVGSKPMEFGLQMMGLVEKYYPERLDKAFVINVPGFFHILWRIVHPLIPAATKKRLFVMRSVEELHKRLLEEMDDEDIPVEYGGKETRHLYDTQHETAVRQLAEKLTSAAAH
ncbi:g10795 [Coccomyxa viridis]|uniref:G10795 protein n=1 Tax=Coccomyxa viridis TaxID=1274662 RepID=A0ABP1G909_9CHLO